MLQVLLWCFDVCSPGCLELKRPTFVPTMTSWGLDETRPNQCRWASSASEDHGVRHHSQLKFFAYNSTSLIPPQTKPCHYLHGLEVPAPPPRLPHSSFHSSFHFFIATQGLPAPSVSQLILPCHLSD